MITTLTGNCIMRRNRLALLMCLILGGAPLVSMGKNTGSVKKDLGKPDKTTAISMVSASLLFQQRSDTIPTVRVRGKVTGKEESAALGQVSVENVRTGRGVFTNGSGEFV